MSVEFRLKCIREVIDKNVNDVLLKWNARKVLLNEPFDEDRRDICTACLETGEQRFLQYLYVNMDEAVYKCESSACLFPFRNFKYKNYVDRTIFRYERIVTSGVPEKSEQKMFTSPAKVESVNFDDDFNLNWLDTSFTTESDLDTILASPSATTCDIKDIINDICNNVDTSSIISATIHNDQLPKAPAAKLSKCLKYIEHLSPSKRPFLSKVEAITPPPDPFSNDTSSNTSNSLVRFVPMSKTVTKSIKKNRNTTKKNRQIKPVKTFNKDQHPLKCLDWLSCISKIEPKNIHEFEFASPTSVGIEDRKQNLPKNTEQASDPSKTQPILIEFMGTTDSYVLDGNQLPINGELQTTQNVNDGPPNVEEYISSAEQISTTTNSTNNLYIVTFPNAKHSSDIKEEGSHSNLQVIKTEPESSSQQSNHDTASFEEQHSGQTETQRKIDEPDTLKKTKRKYTVKKIKNEQRKIEKTKNTPQRREVIKVNKQTRNKLESCVNRKSFNIEVEDIFRGFEPLEPFRTTALQRKPLIWFKNE